MSFKYPKFFLPALAAALIYQPFPTYAQSPDALFEFEDIVDSSSYKLDDGVEVSSQEQDGSQALKVQFPAGGGYPAVRLPLPEGRLELSAYQGIQADITNAGQSKIGVGLRADNPGDWKKEPWNTETIYLNPGQTKTIKLTFGKSFGNKGFALDAGNISNVQIFGVEPKDGGTILVDHVKAFGATSTAAPASPAAPVAVPVTPAPETAAPASSGASILESNVDASGFKTEEGAVVSIEQKDGAPAVKIDFPSASGYPAVKFPVPVDGKWNLAGSKGIQVEITNAGQAKVGVGLRADNAGDWKKEPWNTETIYLNPGQTKTLKLTFGKSHGNTGFALDPSAITNIQMFAINPKDGATIVVSGLQAFGSAAAGTVSAAAASTTAGAAGSEKILVVDASTDPSSFQVDDGVDVAVDSSSSALKIQFGTQGSYPAVRLPKPADGWDLSKFTAVAADVENTGATPVVVALRVDNPGDWRQSPWNTEMTKLAPGQKKKLMVTFGKSDGGNPGYPLDSSKVSNIQIFSTKPPADSSVLVHGVSAVGTAAVKGGTAAAQGEESLNAPAISGELLILNAKTQPSEFETKSAVVSMGEEQGAKVLNVRFQAQESYPAVEFPIPDGGWNLAHFAGVQVDVTNNSDKPVMAGLRMDNPGDWKTEPWNTQLNKVGPGETKTIQAYFGKNNGAPGFPLNSANISKLQVFLEKPKQDTEVVVSDLKAFGTAEASATESFTKPADREKPVTVPEWVGKRPPVEGNWVETLNENFEGAQLNEKIWTPRLIWDGPAKGELQRYAQENVTVKDGVATILCEKRSGHQYNNPALETREYTTGAFTTFGKWTQKYGYFEAKVKLPTARGLWPAFWTMPDRGPEAGDVWQRRETKAVKGNGMEMDIFEHLTEWGSGRFNIAAHWDGYGPEHKQWGNSHTYYGPTADGWHVAGMLWEPGKLTWFLDGVKVGEWKNDRICDVPSYLKFTVQMGNWATKNVDDAKLPDKFQIDYVRAWQLKDRLAEK